MFMTCLILCWSCFGMCCTRLLVCCSIWHKHVTADLYYIVRWGFHWLPLSCTSHKCFTRLRSGEFGGHITPENCCFSPTFLNYSRIGDTIHPATCSIKWSTWSAVLQRKLVCVKVISALIAGPKDSKRTLPKTSHCLDQLALFSWQILVPCIF